MQFKTVCLCAFLFLVLPAMSFAGGPTCSTATAVIPDGRSLELDYVGPSGPNGIAWYQFGATANRSYSVEVRDDLDPDNADFTVSFYAPPVTCPTPTSNTNYTDTHSIEPAAGPRATRFSFVAAATGAYYISVQNGNATTGHYVTVTVVETTIYGGTWNTYNPLVTQWTFQNTTSQSIAYTLTLTTTVGGTQTYNTSGTLGAVSTPTSTLSTGTSTFNVPLSQLGYSIFTHNGPPGRCSSLRILGQLHHYDWSTRNDIRADWIAARQMIGALIRPSTNLIFEESYMRRFEMQFKTVCLCAFLFSVLPAISFAGGPTCALATGLIPDGRSLSLDYVQPNNGTVWYSFNTTAGHSYSVEVRDDLDANPNNDLQITFWSSSCATQMTVGPTGTPPTYSPNQYHDATAIEPKVIPNTGMRVSIPNPAADTISIRVINGNPTTGHYLTVTVAETTLYSPNYNSVSPSFTMYYSLANTTSSSLYYTMTVYDSSGAQIPGAVSGTPPGTPTLLNARSTNYLNSTSGFLATNNYGTVILTHDAPPAALQIAAVNIWVIDSTHTVLQTVPFAPIRQLR